MKKLFISLTIAFFSSQGFANITGDQEYLLNHFGTVPQATQLGTLVNKTKNLLIAKYSFAKQGGSTAADISLLTDLNNPKSLAKLPTKAIITNVWFDVVTVPTSTSTANIAFTAVNAGDLLAATSKAAFVARLQGIPNGATVATYLKTVAEKTIKATVTTTALTAGKINVYIEYVIGD